MLCIHTYIRRTSCIISYTICATAQDFLNQTSHSKETLVKRGLSNFFPCPFLLSVSDIIQSHIFLYPDQNTYSDTSRFLHLDQSLVYSLLLPFPPHRRSSQDREVKALWKGGSNITVEAPPVCSRMSVESEASSRRQETTQAKINKPCLDWQK